MHVHNFDDLDQYNDIDNVAALVAALDIVVSVRISVAHIAAGVGTSIKLTIMQSTGNNILHSPVGPDIKIFERNTWEPWNMVFQGITNDIMEQVDLNNGE